MAKSCKGLKGEISDCFGGLEGERKFLKKHLRHFYNCPCKKRSIITKTVDERCLQARLNQFFISKIFPLTSSLSDNLGVFLNSKLPVLFCNNFSLFMKSL